MLLSHDTAIHMDKYRQSKTSLHLDIHYTAVYEAMALATTDSLV